MRQEGLISRQMPQHKYAKADKAHTLIPNVLGRQFQPDKPNKVWCGDVTYVWGGSGWIYLAVVIDLFARRIVGYATSKSPDSELTKKALRMATRVVAGPIVCCFTAIKDAITPAKASANSFGDLECVKV